MLMIKKIEMWKSVSIKKSSDYTVVENNEKKLIMFYFLVGTF